MKHFTKEENSWVFYDWANSAYSIIISTAVFPLFYKAAATNAGISATHSTAYLGYTIAIATFILAIIGPILGTIADYQGFKKKFFTFFFSLGIIFTASLAFIPSNQWLLLLICYTITSVGFAGANVFYDAFLIDVTTEERMNQVSARGFGIGYIGSTIPFLISIVMIILAQQKIIPVSTTMASQTAFLITALWWALFTIPLFRNVRQLYYIEREPNPSSIALSVFETRLEIFANTVHYFYSCLLISSISMVSGRLLPCPLPMDPIEESARPILFIILFVTQVVVAPFAIIYGKTVLNFQQKKCSI